MFLPSAGIESAQAWEGTTVATYSFVFQLLNTVRSGDVDRNKRLLDSLTFNNLMDKQDIFRLRPPVIYSLEIPGVRNSPAAVISNLRSEGLGQINKIGTENIPDAYEVTITIQELLRESRQIFESISNQGASDVVVAIQEPNIEAADSFNDIVNNLASTGT